MTQKKAEKSATRFVLKFSVLTLTTLAAFANAGIIYDGFDRGNLFPGAPKYGPGPFSSPAAACRAYVEWNNKFGSTQYTFSAVVKDGTEFRCDVKQEDNSIFTGLTKIQQLCSPAAVDLNAGPSYLNTTDGKSYFIVDSSAACPMPPAAAPVADKNLGYSGTCPVGNPINPANGNKLEVEVDYASPVSELLKFERVYNSFRPSYGSSLFFGYASKWTTNWERRLVISGDGVSVNNVATISRPDGGQATFFLVNGLWKSQADSEDLLTELKDVNGNVTGYKLRAINDLEDEVYDAQGWPMSVTKIGSGDQVTLNWGVVDAEGNRKLNWVADRFGRKISFFYLADGRLSYLTTPFTATNAAQGKISFTYTAAGYLDSVIYPHVNGATVTTATRKFHYDEAGLSLSENLVQLLTGITDERNVRIGKYSYDTQGRAWRSERLAAGAHEFVFSEGSTLIKEPLGNQVTMAFNTISNVVLPATTTANCGVCGTSLESREYYPDNGKLKQSVDRKGNITTYVYTYANGVEISKEVDENPGNLMYERKITTVWDPRFRLPKTILELGLVTDFEYDDAGRLKLKRMTDTASARKRETTFTYEYGTTATLLPYVKKLTVNGPRTDKADITVFDYDATGKLLKETNALNHVTNYNLYDTEGRLTKMTDPNGLVIEYTYHPRGWMRSKKIGTALTTFEYYPNGLLQKASPAGGLELTYTYDASKRMADVADSRGNSIHYDYDAADNMIKETVLDSTGQLAAWVESIQLALTLPSTRLDTNQLLKASRL